MGFGEYCLGIAQGFAGQMAQQQLNVQNAQLNRAMYGYSGSQTVPSTPSPIVSKLRTNLQWLDDELNRVRIPLAA